MSAGLALPIIRHLLQMLGGILIAYGLIDESTLEPLLGFGLSGATFIWYLLDRKKNLPKAPKLY